jgi:hypothetical protein
MFVLGSYQLPEGVNLGQALRTFLRKEGIAEKEIFADRLSKGEASKLMSGQTPFDFNKIYAWLSPRLFVSFTVELLAMKAREVGETEKTEAA